MKKSLLLLLACTCMWACSDNPEEKRPDELLPERTMALVLIDAHLGEAGLLQVPHDRDSNQALYARYMQQVYKKHGVDPKVFEESYKYYSQDPKAIDAIYLIVVDSLSAMEGKEGFVQPEMHNVPPAPVPDSI